VTLVSKDQDRPNDPLSLSTQQSRLVRQTWASVAGSIGRSSDGETQTSLRPKYRRNRRGRVARPDSTNITSASSSTVSSTDKSKSMFFRHLKNIEEVSKTVDERMQKRKVQKEWSTKVISETARLRDEEGLLKKEKMNSTNNMQMHGERSPSNDNADIASTHVDDAFDDDDDDDNDLLGLGTPQRSDDRDPESELMEEEVPTSQSQERYLFLSHLSQISPTGSLGASCAPINGSTATT
jgi:hypothetical protein